MSGRWSDTAYGQTVTDDALWAWRDTSGALHVGDSTERRPGADCSPPRSPWCGRMATGCATGVRGASSSRRRLENRRRRGPWELCTLSECESRLAERPQRTRLHEGPMLPRARTSDDHAAVRAEPDHAVSSPGPHCLVRVDGVPVTQAHRDRPSSSTPSRVEHADRSGRHRPRSTRHGGGV